MSALFPSSHGDRYGVARQAEAGRSSEGEVGDTGPRNGVSWASWESPIQFQGSPWLGCVQAENSSKQFPPELVREIRE